jgi:hypothetical protein
MFTELTCKSPTSYVGCAGGPIEFIQAFDTFTRLLLLEGSWPDPTSSTHCLKFCRIPTGALPKKLTSRSANIIARIASIIPNLFLGRERV